MSYQYDPATEYETAPLGIKLYCLIAGLVGLYLLFLALDIMSYGGPAVGIGFLFLGLAIGYLVVLYGLWMLKPWAWTLAMIIFTFDLLTDFILLDVVGIIISVVLIAYLWSKRSYYGK